MTDHARLRGGDRRRLRFSLVCYWVLAASLAALSFRYGVSMLTDPRPVTGLIFAVSFIGLVAVLALRFGPGKYYSSVSLRRRVESDIERRDRW